MSKRLLFIKLLLAHFITQSPADIQANCSNNVTLECLSFSSNSSNFLSLTWYKLQEVSNQTEDGRKGIIQRSNDRENPFIDFTRPASFGQNYSLLLPDVRPGDTGTYMCYIIANIGGKNKENLVDLIIHECEVQSNRTNSSQIDEALPLLWSAVGCVAVAFCKVVFSLIGIWAIEEAHSRASKRRLHNLSC